MQFAALLSHTLNFLFQLLSFTAFSLVSVPNHPIVSNIFNFQYVIQIHNEEINDLLNQGQTDDKGLTIRENTTGEIKVLLSKKCQFIIVH